MNNNFSNMENMIERYLFDYYDDLCNDELFRMVENQWQRLDYEFGYGKLRAAVESCLMHTLSDETQEWKKEAAKLTKADIMEINSIIGFLAGIAFAETYRRTEGRGNEI